MADYRAIAAVTEAVASLLESRYVPGIFGGQELEFSVYLAKDFAKPMQAGVSVFLYRIYANGTQRAPNGRTGPDGQRYRTQMPLDLHFLLTAWAQDASLQHAIAGWMMRVLEDSPIIPAGLLNRWVPDVFHEDESVEIVLAEIETETLFRIWEVIVHHAYQISVPYAARIVRIESSQLQAETPPVQTRGFDYQKGR